MKSVGRRDFSDMREYRLTVFDAASARDVSFEFEAETDRDAVRLGAEAAAGQRGVLWREGRLLLSLERFWLDQQCPAHGPGAD
jgi:hypothetical protein